MCLRHHHTSAVVPTTLTSNSSYTIVTLTTSCPLTSSTIHDIVQTPSSWYLEDWAGNNLGSTQTSTFTTGP